MTAKVVLIGGGVRSGKSAFALLRASQLGQRRAFIATAEVRDDEMRERVERHREERGDAFRTIESPRALTETLQALSEVEVVVVDCLTLWLSNLLLDALSEVEIAERVEAFARALEQRRFSTVLVTNEVGLGIVPENALARRFRDIAGRAHQRLGRGADEVYLAALGQLLRLKPGPVAAV